MRRILISGGGYAGFYTAWKLEKKLRRGEAEVTVVDPRPYMTYQPFLPEVAAGAIDPRHAVIPLRRHLRRTRVIAGKVSSIDHAARTATVVTNAGAVERLDYDVLAVTAGAVPSAPPVPGIAEEAIGLKTVEEAAALRDQLLTHFDEAAGLPPGPQRDRLLTVVVIGAGFAGVEAFGELLSFATALLRRYPELRREDLHFHLVELSGRILPEVSLASSRWVIDHLTERGARIHLNTTVTSAVDGVVELSTGETFESDIILWTAGVKPSPLLLDTDLPVDARNRLRVRADLRVVDETAASSPMRGVPATSPPSRTSAAAGSTGTPCRTRSTPSARAGCWRRTSSPTCADAPRATTFTTTWVRWPHSDWAAGSSSRDRSPCAASRPG